MGCALTASQLAFGSHDVEKRKPGRFVVLPGPLNRNAEQLSLRCLSVRLPLVNLVHHLDRFDHVLLVLHLVLLLLVLFYLHQLLEWSDSFAVREIFRINF